MERERSAMDRLDDYDRRRDDRNDDRRRDDDHDGRRYREDDDSRDARKRATQYRNDKGDRVATKELQNLVDRIERLEEDKKAIADDIKDVYAEAKGHGFDVSQLRRLIGIRKKDPAERMKADEILDQYMMALGMPDR